MEFDKSRCYSAINADELHNGDKVIGANTISKLRERVEQFEENDVVEIGYIAPDTEARRFNEDYLLAYLVKRKENCTNCGNRGNSYCPRVTRDKSDDDELSRTVCGNYIRLSEQKRTDYNHCEAARKACDLAMTKAEPHYRPFKDTDELIKVWCDKGGKWQKRELTMPHIWLLRNKSNKGSVLITGFTTLLGASAVEISGELHTMEYLRENYTFLDGSPCGVEE